MLKKGLPIFFGSDVGKQSDSQKGIMDTDLVSPPVAEDLRNVTILYRLLASYASLCILETNPDFHADLYQVDYELGFNVKLGMSKAERLLTGESQMTHAMVLTAVHLDADSKPVRWRVENSWSASAGTEGYFVMSDKWMDEFCYQAVVDPSMVDKAVRDVLGQEAKVLPLWDPMGALA